LPLNYFTLSNEIDEKVMGGLDGGQQLSLKFWNYSQSNDAQQIVMSNPKNSSGDLPIIVNKSNKMAEQSHNNQ
jgi:hypothetical protein